MQMTLKDAFARGEDIHRVTVLSRGRNIAAATFGDSEATLLTRSSLHNQLVATLGGIAAENAVLRPERRDARRSGVERVGDPDIGPPLLDPLADLLQIRLQGCLLRRHGGQHIGRGGGCRRVTKSGTSAGLC
mgnify:CR=1 FL=1